MYVVVSANNIDSDIEISEVFATKEEASCLIKKIHDDIINEPGDCRVVCESYNENKYCVTLENDDVYYGCIKKIDF